MTTTSPIASTSGPISQSTLSGTQPGIPTIANSGASSAADATHTIAEPAFATLLASTLSGQPGATPSVVALPAVALPGQISSAHGVRPSANGIPQPLTDTADAATPAHDPEHDPTDPNALAALPWLPFASVPTIRIADPTASASLSLPAHPQPDRSGQPAAIGAAPGDPLNPVNADPLAIRPDHGRTPSADPANPTGQPQHDPATLADPHPAPVQPTGSPHARSTDQASQPAILLASIGREGITAADHDPTRLSVSETGIEALTGHEPTQAAESSRPSTSISALHPTVARPIATDRTDQRAQDIAAQIGWQLGTRINKAEIRLSPPELGSVTIQIEQEGRQLRLDFVAASAEARSALEDTLPKLRDLLATQGHDLIRAQIGTGADPDRRPTTNPQHPTRHDTDPHPESTNPSIPQSTTRIPLGLLDEYA